MIRLLSVAFFLCCCGLLAQPVRFYSYTILDQAANDMVFDSATSQLLISIPASDTTYGNSIGYIDPDPVFFSHAHAVGHEPGPLAITSSCNYLYVGLSGANSIKKFSIATGVATQSFLVGSDPFLGPMHANNISCKPGTDSVIAVARRISGINFASAGAVIFKNGQMLSNAVAEYSVTIDLVKFQSPNTVYAFNNENDNFDFYNLAVNGSGASLVSNSQNVMSGLNDEFYILGNKAVSDHGAAVDLSGPQPVVSGTYNISAAVQHPKACFDPYLNLVCFAYKNATNDTVVIERFHRDSYQVYDHIKIGGIQHEVTRLVTWGDSTNYAFCTRGPQLVVIGKRRLITGIQEQSLKEISFRAYPNPVASELFVEAPEPLTMEVINVTGQVVMVSTEKKMDISALPQGMYVLRARTRDGKIAGMQKMLKQ